MSTLRDRQQTDDSRVAAGTLTAASRALHRVAAVQDKLFELYDRMLGDVHIPRVLRDVADVVCQDLGAERASVYLIDKATQELESVAVIGNVAQTIRVPISPASLAGYCALNGRAFVVPDAYGDLSGIDPALRFDRSWDQKNEFRTRDVMCAPALFKGEVMGVVQVMNSTGRPFDSSDLLPLRTISRVIGYALYHARLYDDLATLKQLEKEKAGFIRIMVHELKSPVAAAKMLADALADHDHIVDSEVAPMTARISGRMGQLMDMIRDLLHLARVRSGDPLGEIGTIDLVAETRAVCDTHREHAQQKNLDWSLTLPDQPLPVRCDAQGYRLVVSNLASNGIKYTAAGHVRVSLRRDESRAILEVSDSGIGIPEADVPKLFQEFFRASNARRKHIEGSGVGLAGAKAIVERFGGTFALKTRENEGTTFTVRLPLSTT